MIFGKNLENKHLSFEKEMILRGVIPNLLAIIAIFVYSSYFIGLHQSQILTAIIIILVIIFPTQIIIAPLTNKLILGDLIERVSWWKKNGCSSNTERTNLLQDIMRFPKKKGLEAFTYFFICAILMFFGYDTFLRVNFYLNIISFISCLFGAYNAGIMSYSFASDICSRIARQIYNQGIDETRVERAGFYNLSIKTQFLFNIVIPIIATSILSALVIKTFNVTGVEFKVLEYSRYVHRLIVILICNVVICITLALQFITKLIKMTETMHSVLKELSNGSVSSQEKLVPVDFSNELSRNMHLINKTIHMFRNVLNRASDIGTAVYKTTNDLSVTSKQTASTSLEQSAGVKEVVSTMEKADSLSKDISIKMNEVSTIASKNVGEVMDGYNVLKSSLDKMLEIKKTNLTTINSIKSLNTEIEDIWEIVNIINSIADQTKIIAFNAELEATNAGKDGKNFHIVANEVRRLASGTMDSVHEIRERITNIQKASNNLITTSEHDSRRVEEGYTLTQKLEEKFMNIQETSESTTGASLDIQKIIEQQTTSFDQIVITLKQISIASDNFSSATSIISKAVDELRSLSTSLNNILTPNENLDVNLEELMPLD
jgi:methyl-accepting chemotaxis protein